MPDLRGEKKEKKFNSQEQVIPRKTKGDRVSSVKKHGPVTLSETVRAKKKTSTPVASDRTTDKGGADKNRVTSYHKENKVTLYSQSLRTSIRSGMHSRITQMGHYNGFPNR